MYRGSVPSVSSQSQHTFSRAPQAGIPRSTFNRTFGVKTTFNEGYLVPILADEMLPGDTFSLKMHAFARISTLLFPIMDNLYLESFFFFVPNRLVWTNWENFCQVKTSLMDTTDYTIPQQTGPTVTGYAEGSLADYFGIPTLVTNLTPNALHFRAYNLIWNEWFRSQDLQTGVVVDVDDGPDANTDYVLLRRGKRYDYFTSCLPFPQKGPDVELPLGSTAPIDYVVGSTAPVIRDLAGALSTNQTGMYTNASALWGVNPAGVAVSYDPGDYLVADLTDATASTINDLRLAFQTQKFYEKQARGGTRYTEVIKSHFDVISPDMRLQRPEYIGGGSTPVVINPVAQTAPTSGSNALAQLGAYGVCAPEAHGFTYSATEHGVIIGLISVRADLNYQSGLERMWTRQVFTDYYWPVFSHLGEQAVLNQEIYAQGTSADTDVFGYQERHAEYRYKPSLITGLFRSNATGTLDSWHLAQDFGSLPTLNSDFIEEDAPMTRVKAVSASYDFLFDSVFAYHCARPMPVYAVPGLIDHF
ncbi:major capsid protein [Apis mellifera associated microvirus 6]|nr:major capsid protein [Apis mellifera associated microvirus 6]